MKKTIRIIRTYEVQVEAEYGDTPESLCAKAFVAPTTSFVEDRVLMPDSEGGE